MAAGPSAVWSKEKKIEPPGVAFGSADAASPFF
jgi:hypothetical protein